MVLVPSGVDSIVRASSSAMGSFAAFSWAKPREADSKKDKILYFISCLCLAQFKSDELIILKELVFGRAEG